MIAHARPGFLLRLSFMARTKQTELAAMVKGLVKRTNRPSYHSGSYKKGSYWLKRRNPWTGTTKATAQASEDPWTACGMWLEAQQRWLEAGQTQT